MVGLDRAIGNQRMVRMERTIWLEFAFRMERMDGSIGNLGVLRLDRAIWN